MARSWNKVFIIILQLASTTLDLTNCGLTLSKDANDKFYYTVNGHDFPVDFDVGAEIAGLQEKIMFPRDTKNEKKVAPVLNASEDLGWEDPVKRSVKPSKRFKKKDMEDKEADDGKDVKLEEYEYADDDAVSNDDVYENEQSNENAEDIELVTSRPAVANKNHHRKISHAKGSDRHQTQYADEYYEEYEDDTANNKKSNKMSSKSRNTRNDVIRR
ncbi:uncharacterized protein [Rhodnius prolixus]|uniref:uncharacterized protein n=1 Tax=Rhodnius prolixus TaxID=13249 RepID=UPI003D18C326